MLKLTLILTLLLLSIANAKKNCNCSKMGPLKIPRPFNNFRNFNRRRRGRFVRNHKRFKRLVRPDGRILHLVLKNCPKHALERTHSGFCNNLRKPEWGSTDTQFLVTTPTVDYKNKKLPNPREISNIVCKETKSIPNRRGMSELVIFFGQLLDHTFTETENGDTRWPIRIPDNDPVFKNGGLIEFFRTVTKGKGKRRSAVNKLSSYIDAASIYGSSDEDSMGLRTKEQGKMTLTSGDLLMMDGNGSFISGDERANENPNLIALHTLFTREHNSICDQVLRAFPKYSDEKVYQLARKIVAAEFQAIVYHEFLPAVMGRRLPRYRGYKPHVPAAISNAFSTVGFRVGHTMINPRITAITGSGKRKTRLLRHAFFSPKAFREHGMENLLRGVMATRAAEVDARITPEVRDFLFGTDTSKVVQLDLAALNIQRGRDQGIPRYNRVRRHYGLKPVRRFNQITRNRAVATKLRLVYGNVHRVDAWIGGIAEDHMAGASLGPLFYRIWKREFKRLRNGDRFYFENKWQFTRTEIRKIPALHAIVGSRKALGRVFSDIVVRNTGISKGKMPKNPWFVTK